MIRRFQKEMNDFNQYPIPFVHLVQYKIIPGTGAQARAVIIGLKGCIYQGGKFELQINVPSDYPFKPPKIRFLTKVYHPNVYQSKGNICCCTIEELKDQWSPALTIAKLLTKIMEMLRDPDLYLSDCGDQDKIFLYKNDIALFNKKGREWVEEYAKTQ